MEYCPTCSAMSIKQQRCVHCGRSFAFDVFKRRVVAFKRMNDMPLTKEVLPSRIAYEFRDPIPKKCGFTIRRKIA